MDELGYVPLSKTSAELLFEIFSRPRAARHQRYEQASTRVTSNLPFNAWTEIFGSERLTGALLDRLTQHVHILELNVDWRAARPADPSRQLSPRTQQESPPIPCRSDFLKSPPATPLSGTSTRCRMVWFSSATVV